MVKKEQNCVHVVVECPPIDTLTYGTHNRKDRVHIKKRMLHQKGVHPIVAV